MIKELGKKDIPEIIRIQIKSESPVYRKIGLKFNKEGIKKYLSDTLKRGSIFGYFIDNQLIATGGIAFYNDYGEVRHIFTLPEFQKRGIASEIMRYIERSAKRKIKELRLNVLVKNPAAGFYEKMGYKKHVYVMIKRVK